MVCADGRQFRFWFFHFAKNGLFFLQKSSVASAIFKGIFETYDDKVIILRHEEQPNSQGSRKRKKIV